MKLNTKQQEAVDHIYGPLLVLAGPGTGKTQLLSARVANILTKTDASAQNILCLTFTENAAQNMRERLAGIIKDDAYDVHIATYHSFGSDIIRMYPHYFESIDIETGKDSRLEKPIDELQAIQILTEILDKLPYSSSLISAKHYIRNTLSTISELKRALYTPDTLKNLAEQNLKTVREISPKISGLLDSVKRFPSKAEQSLEIFLPIMEILEGREGLAEDAAQDLGNALLNAKELNKSTPLTEWKNKWLTKDEHDLFMLTDEDQHLRIVELAKIFKQYCEVLESRHLYDFDDMILRTIDALRKNNELKYTLQEKYQFILLDEFQDTNAAQFELVKLLADNPANEGMPNIFAVGDDDQAIYAFQGANISNMFAFKHAYRNVKTINLVDNYRSHPDILHFAHGIAEQIETRLHHQLQEVSKTLNAASIELPASSNIERHEFDAEANEQSWVANRIKHLITEGIKPHEIAILAPQHKYLEAIVPFLANRAIPIAYEKRENILTTPEMRMYRTMIELIIACSEDDAHTMNYLFPIVMSYEHFQIPVINIWQINWAYSRDKSISWAEHALSDEVLAPHVMAMLALGLKAQQEPLEYVLDYLTGTSNIHLDENNDYRSPFKDYYFSNNNNVLAYYELLANLSTIREHLRAWQASQERLLSAKDFLRFIEAYETAEQPLINSHPLAIAEDSVQLMTTYKAKGLEFEHVFLLSVHDDVWGKAARSNTNKLSLPANLKHIRYQGSSEDELRRLLFVAITRAKHGLYLTSHSHKDNGKLTEPVKYLMEYQDGNKLTSTLLPAGKQDVFHQTFTTTETLKAVETMWHSRHVIIDTSLKSLISDRLSSYQMSPTHLNTFIDTEYGGPETFLLKTLLRFPQAPSEDGEYGNAIHYALEQHQLRIKAGKISNLNQVLKDFDTSLSKRYILADHIDNYRNRGHNALKTYIGGRKEMFDRRAEAEVNFSKEGVLLGSAYLGGKIDRLEIDKANGTVQIVDFKTGKPHKKWDKELKLLKYRQQLYFYKILIEGSHTWSDYKVTSARLEFIEPDSKGKLFDALEIVFDLNEEQEFKELIKVVWNRIQNLELPDISEFSKDYKGTTEFVNSLLK